jgi:hypothetical protein
MDLRKIFCLGLVGLAVCAAAAAVPNTLMDLRVGPHKQFDRVVFEFQQEVASQVQVRNSQRIDVRFFNVNLQNDFRVPLLPRGLTVLKNIEIVRDGSSDVVFVIQLARDATPSELTLNGQPWRLAVDLAPRISEKNEKPPEYIPGDLPIPTKFAESTTAPQDSQDNGHVHSLLAFYHLSRGDTPSALQEAQIYQQLTGTPLEILPQQAAGPVSPLTTPPQTSLPKLQTPTPLQNFLPPWLTSLGLPAEILLGAIFVAGLLLGMVFRPLLRSIHMPHLRLPKISLKLKHKPRPAKDEVSSELESDIQALDEAIKREPARTAAAAPPPPAPAPEPEPEPEPVEAVDMEKEARESLMDRRVRRVLELSQDGRSVAEIAEELQMGQDEVKLILDLNK